MMNDNTYKPPFKYAIITSELDEENGLWIETLTHIFYGDSMNEIKSIIAAHRTTDSFFNSSFLGSFNDIKLRNEIIGLI